MSLSRFPAAAALGVAALMACVSSGGALPMVAPSGAMGQGAEGAPWFFGVSAPLRRHVVVRRLAPHQPEIVEHSNEIYRPWVKRPYYGAIVGGAALGAIIVAETAHIAPLPPALNMCWSWSDAIEQHGYWDYCVAP
jgi:hypothetical protein